jgi:hypothetical protein
MALKPPIEVRVIWHPDDVPRDESTPVALPEQLFAAVQGDPTLPADEHLRIPVAFHTGRRDEAGRWALPVRVPLDRAEHVVVVALVGDALIDDDAWYEWLTDVRRAVDVQDEEQVRLVGVALTDRADNLDRLWGERSREPAFIYRHNPIERDRFVRLVLLRAVARQLRGGEKVGVFVSYAKADGAAHAGALMDTLRSLKADGFLDVEQIEGGQDFAKVLREGLAPRTVMVAVVSDVYSRRVWCRWEALRAKQQGMPIVVLDIVSDGQQRSVPYLGNTPVVRCNVPSDPDERGEHARSAGARLAYIRALEAGTTELIRSLVFPRQVAVQTARLGLSPDEWPALATPPELLSLIVRRDDLQAFGHAVYPDPPVPVDEADVLSVAADRAKLTTRMHLAAELSGDAPTPLRVGVSVSRSDEASVHRHAQGPLHLDAVFIELCLQLLAAGHVLAYGGDPLKDFTETLRDLDRSYSANTGDQPKRLHNYLARYLWDAPAFRRAELREAMELVNVDRTVDPSEPEVIRPVLDLTAMRQRMTAEIDVRVAVGGDPQPSGSGTRRGPGVIEELYLALRAGVPVLVAGGFGGASEVVAQALQGQLDDATVEALRAHFAPIEPELAATGAPHTFRDMLAAFSRDTDLRNGLTVEENAELLTTEDIDTAVALILTSVHRLATSTSP